MLLVLGFVLVGHLSTKSTFAHGHGSLKQIWDEFTNVPPKPF